MKRVISRLGSSGVTMLLCFGCKNNIPNTSPIVNPAVTADSMMIVSARKEASEAGVWILMQGGNAFDAAIAVHFALAVVYPQAGNLGGGGFMIAHTENNENLCLDFRETAPMQASADMYLNSDESVDQKKSLLGGLACGVPGSVRGMLDLHKKYGTMPWAKLLMPAIKLAEDGFVLTTLDIQELESVQHDLDLINGPNIFTSRSWHVGDTLRQIHLANTLKQLAVNPEDFYQGEIANQIARDVGFSGGIMQITDLQNYKSIWREPLIIPFRGYQIVTMPPPGSGGIVLGQMLIWLDWMKIDLYSHNSARYIQLLAELEKRAYADRSEYLADPDFFHVPIRQLLDTLYLINRLHLFPFNGVTPSSNIKHMPVSEHEQTTHFSIVDAKGNAVSITTTLNSAYGSKLIIKDAGFLMNNEMDDFAVAPGVKNQFGLIGGKANCIEPGKRMLSSMTPTVVLKDNQPVLVLGSPGGATIITTVLQNILNVLVYGMDIQQSVDQLRFHHQWLPDVLYLEEGWKAHNPLMDSLQSMGYVLQFRSPIGRVSAIMKNKNERWEAGVDKRGDNYASGR